MFLNKNILLKTLPLLRNRVAEKSERVAVLDGKFSECGRGSRNDRGKCGNLHRSTFHLDSRHIRLMA